MRSARSLAAAGCLLLALTTGCFGFVKRPPPKECSHCDGTGEIECLGCGGDGKTMVFGGQDENTCTMCRGTGHLDCGVCGGKGKI